MISGFSVVCSGDNSTFRLTVGWLARLLSGGVSSCQQPVLTFVCILLGTFSNCRVPTQELVDYFFYALLRTQGEDTTEERSTASVVPVAEVPNIMRALGYYPTEQVGFRKFPLAG